MLRMSSTATNTVNVRQNLKVILDKLSEIYNETPETSRAVKTPRLVAVSKTKPKEMVIEAYEAGQRHFGENYPQELKEKSSDPEMLEKCPDIKWHFTGTVQSGNISKLVKSPNLSMVETISSSKQADKFQGSCKSNKVSGLGVMVQVNTSGEENKGGVQPDEVVEVAKHIIEKCPNIEFQGLMTIGALAHSVAREPTVGPNPDFLTLLDCKKKIIEDLKLEPENIELSMGMSNDFEEAIQMGSTNIRVGSSIFGARNVLMAKPEAPKTEILKTETAKTEDLIETLSQDLQATQMSK